MLQSVNQKIAKAAYLLFSLCALLIVWASPVAAKAPNIAASLMLESANPAAGESVQAAIVMQPNEGWHGYWMNGGNAGFGMEVEWNLPEGVSISPLEYPVPEALILFGMMNHVYEHPYALLMQVNIADDIPEGTDLSFSGMAQWLACTDKICVPERAMISAKMIIGDGVIGAENRARFDAWRAALPRPLDQNGLWQRSNQALRFAIPLPADVALENPHLFIATSDAMDYAAPQSFSRNGEYIIVEAKPKGSHNGPIEGLLKLADGRGLLVNFTAANVPAAGEIIAGAAPSSNASLFALSLGGAILGGLILNLMPCVFPILSLKALSLARAGSGAREAKVDALAYTAGAVLICLLLGGLLLALRAAGEQVGWAFQLQHPFSVLILLLLSAVITLNLMGLFEIPSFAGGARLANQGGAAGGFWTGALAAFVATPCSGPLLGAALGATLALPAWAALPIFGGLGLGLALPFLAIGFIPALRRRLPKPGAWMERFRKIMAIPMALTSLALIWLLWRQTGSGAMLGLALLITALAALLLWQWGAAQRGHARKPIILGLMLATLGGTAFAATQMRQAESQIAGDGIAYSETALAAARASGKPIFLYFTADWCLSCKANEAAAINRENTQAAMKAADVQILVADWTNGDPEITRKLAEFGRNSVPLYLWYPPHAASPEILPQILTPSMLIERAKASGTAQIQEGKS